MNYKTGRKVAVMKQHEVEEPCGSLYPGVYHDYDDRWSLDAFKKHLQIKVIKSQHDKNEMEFDIIGVDASIANSFRRILLVEVPSMAIEKVFMYNNTSIVQDEVLAHRLGLIPLKADARLFEIREEDSEERTEQDTLQFELKVKCSWNPKKRQDATDPDDMYINHKVMSSHIKWIPMGTQAQMYRAADVGPVVGDILLAKLRPGHELDMKLHAVKGIGADHAKFSPVATAYYRLLPQIILIKEVEGDLAKRLQNCFSPGVIKIVNKDDGKQYAEVHDARYDSCSRNVLHYDDLAECVVLSRVKDHFIFSVESVGAMPPDALFVESIKVLMRKCRKFLAEVDKTDENQKNDEI